MKQECVLIVEADILIRHPLSEYLRECGYIVVEAAGAEEAREILLENKEPAIDVVLADATPSGDSAFVLASWIRSHRPGLKIILAGTVAKAAEKAGELCEDGPGLAKPYDHRVVLDHIRRSMAERGRRDRTD
jgi:DNA-binding NtrC family response regulator